MTTMSAGINAKHSAVDMVMAEAAYSSSAPEAADIITLCVITGMADSAVNTAIASFGIEKAEHMSMDIAGAATNRISIAVIKLHEKADLFIPVSAITKPTYISASGDTVSPK